MAEEFDEFGIPIKKASQVDEFGIPVKKKSASENPATSSSGSLTVVKPSSENGAKDSFLAEANSLQPSEEQKREEQFQQTGNTGQANLKAKTVKLADKQLAKNNIETEATKNFKAIEENEMYPQMQQMKALQDKINNPVSANEQLDAIAEFDRLKAMPVSDDWRKDGRIQVSESQNIPVPNLKKSVYKTYGEMWDATQKASENFTKLKGDADLLDAELIPAIQQKRNDAAYIPDGVDEQGNEYLKLNPMQTFIEGFGGSVDAIGLGLKKLNPLYSREELKNDLKIKYLRENVLFPKQADEAYNIKTPLGDIPTGEATGMLGGVTPLIATGGVAGGGLGAMAVNALTFGTMDLGGGLYEGFAEAKGKGLSDDEAMAYADKIGLEKGATGTILGGTMPMQSALGRKIFINQAEAGALKTFLAEQGVMVPAFMGKATADNIAAREFGSDRQVNEGVGGAGVSAFMIGLMTHAIGAGIKIPAKTKDVFENAIAKNYTSLGAVINKAATEGVIDLGTSQRIAEKAKAFEVVPKDLEAQLEEKILPKQIEIDNLTKESEGKKGAFVEANETRIEELNKEIHEDLGTPLNSKEQKRYDDLIAKREDKPAEGKPKEKMTTPEKTELKHFEKRIKVAEKKVEKIENDRAEGLETVDAEPPVNEAKEETVVDAAVEKPVEIPVEEAVVTDEALQFIDDHAVQGEIQKGDYRPDFGMTSKELTRGLEQIRQGKDGAPAKQIRAKIAEWKEKGFVDMIAGGGGTKSANDRRAIPYDIVKEVSELTEAEATEVLPKIDEIQSKEANLEEWVTSKGYEKPDGTLDLEKLSVDLKSAEENPWSDFLELTDEQFNNLKQAVENEKSNTAPKETSDASGSKDNEGQAQKRTKLEEKIDGINGAKETERNNPIGKEVTFEHAGSEKSGTVVSIDEKGNYKVKSKTGINFTVKPGDAVLVRPEVAELQTKTDALLNDIRKSLTPEKPTDSKKDANEIVKMGVPGTQQLADLPNKLFQNVLAEKVVRPLEDYVAKTIQKATVSSNKAKRNIADFLTSFSRGIVDTQEYSKDKRQFTGDINTAKLEAQDMHKSMWDLIGGDLNSADRVHQVLDPELRQTGLTYADLTPAEQQLFDLLRKINDYTHNENFLIQRISQETFDKFKDKYIGREYDYEMSYDPQIGKPLKEILGIYKQRGDVDIEKQLHSIKDPIYLTLRRFLQTGQNKAIVEYADLLNEQYSTGNARGNEPLILTKAEAKDREGFVELGKGFGKLSNKFVARHIAEDFKGFTFNNAFIQMAYDLNRVYDGLAPRQWMKELLTVGNPQVQLGNFTSNVIFSWMGGVDMPTYLSKLPEAIKQISDKGAIYRSLVKEGLLGTDFVSADLKPMQTKLGAPQSKNSLVKGREKLRSLYGGADNAAKIQMYLSLKDMGYTHEQSVKTIFESLQNYQNTGRIWDFASKTPIVGNAFVKFTPEMLRMLKNGATRRPLHTMALMGLLYSMPKMIGKYFGNDDDEIDAAGRQKGIPKIMIPYTDISMPLSWRVGDKRINIARYMMPMYQYDIGGESKVATDFANKFIPYKVKTTEEGGLEPSVDDPFVAPIISVIRNKDFRDKQITEETDNSFDKTMKRLRYVGRGYGGWYAGMVDDIFSTSLTGEDFYGRRKTATDIALNTIIKVETFDDARLKEGIEREFDGYGRATNSLYSEYTKKRKALQSDLEQVKEDKKMTSDRKKDLTERAEKKLQHLSENVLEEIAEIQEKQLEATEFYRNLSRKQPYTDLQKHFSETEKEISQIEKRIDGKFKDSPRPKFKGFKAFSVFKKTGK